MKRVLLSVSSKQGVGFDFSLKIGSRARDSEYLEMNASATHTPTLSYDVYSRIGRHVLVYTSRDCTMLC